MTDPIQIYDPTATAQGAGAASPPAPAPATADTSRPPLTSLAGKVVGIIDNSKPNFNHLADALATLLQTRHGVAEVRRHRKHAASLPAAAGIAADFAAHCDLVLTGSGD